MFAVSNIAAVQQGKATVCGELCASVLGELCGWGIDSTFSSDGTVPAIRTSSINASENRHPLYAVDEQCMCKAYGAKQQQPPRRLGCGAVPCCRVHTGVPGAVTRSSSSRCRRFLLYVQ